MKPVMMLGETHEQQAREMMGRNEGDEERMERKRDGGLHVLPHP